jgi:hydrogenase maturation protease
MTGLLIAGIGNIFQGDDGFGAAVAGELARRRLPEGVRVVDFGIRGLDLAYALLDGDGAAILVDIVQRDGPPGTLYVIEPEAPTAGDVSLSPHAMAPHDVLRLASVLGAPGRRILLVGCEPARFGESEFGTMALSPPVAAAVARAADTVEDLARELLEQEVS